MPAEQSIHVLTDVVANKIAAGEVVERPASVLKELLENALDAQATQIDVQIVCGGRTLVAVADNGRGMSRDDALLSVERHATSKIRDLPDLERIGTLGFRGEALAAISAVARFRLCTRRAADLMGAELIMAGGKIQEVRDAGCPSGTSVEVRHLFFNVPARRKFLRSEQTELAHLRRVFMTYSLAHPAVGLKLTIDGRLIANLAPGAAFEERRRDLFSFLAPGDLRPVNYLSGGVRVTGQVALPSVSRADRAEQYIFINARPTSAPLVSAAVREGYHTLLPRDRYPVVFLFLELDPALVDVNVHPTKREVRFYSPGAVRETVTAAVRAALALDGAFVPQPVRGALRPLAEATRFGGAHPPLWGLEAAPAELRFPYPARPAAPAGAELPVAPGMQAPPPPGLAGDATAASGQPAAVAAPWAWCRILGQIGNLYVVLETEDGLALMDPHAAHERVLYERFMAQLTQGRIESQGLLVPETVELPPQDALQVRRHLELLKRLGFGIAEFGGDTFVVDALPICFQSAASRTLLADVAAILVTAGERRSAENLLEEQVAQAACKAAVKAHVTLTGEEIEDLVRQLAGTEMPYTCPHGRPTLIHTSFQELAKKFGRA
ncbi:MAG: DNA mismatch repair endonuclease MutL [Lentisphaerae bacterium]|nr:DNA mismatch repair endonuclease MutL [Lentisphaerota bacterium]